MADVTKEPLESQDEPTSKPADSGVADAAWAPFPSRRKLRGGGSLFGTSPKKEPEADDNDEPDQ